MTSRTHSLAFTRATRQAQADLTYVFHERFEQLAASAPSRENARHALAREQPGAFRVLRDGWRPYFLAELGLTPRPVGERSGGFIAARRDRLQ